MLKRGLGWHAQVSRRAVTPPLELDGPEAAELQAMRARALQACGELAGSQAAAGEPVAPEPAAPDALGEEAAAGKASNEEEAPGQLSTHSVGQHAGASWHLPLNPEGVLAGGDGGSQEEDTGPAFAYHPEVSREGDSVDARPHPWDSRSGSPCSQPGIEAGATEDGVEEEAEGQGQEQADAGLPLFDIISCVVCR